MRVGTKLAAITLLVCIGLVAVGVPLTLLFLAGRMAYVDLLAPAEVRAHVTLLERVLTYCAGVVGFAFFVWPSSRAKGELPGETVAQMIARKKIEARQRGEVP